MPVPLLKHGKKAPWTPARSVTLGWVGGQVQDFGPNNAVPPPSWR